MLNLIDELLYSVPQFCISSQRDLGYVLVAQVAWKRRVLFRVSHQEARDSRLVHFDHRVKVVSHVLTIKFPLFHFEISVFLGVCFEPQHLSTHRLWPLLLFLSGTS